MIKNIEVYKELAINDCILREKIKQLLKEIEEKHSMYPYMRTFSNYYRYKGSYETQDILRMEDEFGLKMGHCNSRGDYPYINFTWHKTKKPQDKLFKTLNKLIDDWERNAQKIIDIRGKSAYTDMYILGKIYDVELPIKENWGFMIRTPGIDDDKLSIEDIISIENETDARFTYRDTYGYHFVWNLPVIDMEYKV